MWCFLIPNGIVLADEASVPQFDSPPEKYTSHKVIGGVVGDPSGTAQVVDEILIGNKSKEGITFWFYLYGPNFHICSMAGEAKAVASNDYQYREGNCELHISVSPKKVKVEDVGGYCKQSGNCGSRAYIGTSEFKKGG